ncbi:MAG: NINE protein [Bacteroidetes bacterium]|jgi:TM2 domain-containing membrane protein YozV|nr:NINE protein [Bacteroidota bacterium]
MKQAMNHFPELEGDELHYISNIINDMPEEELELFKSAYRSRRKDPVLFLILTLIGIVGIAGIHRFVAGHIGMGILYLFTVGLCYVGTIVDIINYKNFSFEYNRKQAIEILAEMR